MEEQKKRHLRDIYLVLILLVLSLSVFLIFRLGGEKGTSVRVYLDGELYATLPLDTDTELDVGEGNRLCISGGRVSMIYADCPDGLCVRQGEIDISGERIVCLPNKVIIEVVGGDGEII